MTTDNKPIMEMTTEEKIKHYIALIKEVLSDRQWWIVWLLCGVFGYLVGAIIGR